ncbi:hypothetical protein LDR44_004786 [Salmonella enterica]|nr:hypothetical protein [Salmonella enterica]EFR3658356.1 hypothetical protein [Salmonella enterica]EIE7706166.1 hypothetical protein [Salmonella enterica]EIN2108492.1 hypothetical protein [Salmonella enterica]EIO8765080.1 hypothetical protein [Salmonella enterica]
MAASFLHRHFFWSEVHVGVMADGYSGGLKSKVPVNFLYGGVMFSGKRSFTLNHGISPENEGRYLKKGETYFYRLDFRPPSVIFREGFAGSRRNDVMNLIYGPSTVFCSRSLPGVISYSCEALLGRRPGDGEPGKGLQYAPADAYVYAFCADGLEYISVMSDLGFPRAVRRGELGRPDAHSVILSAILSKTPVPTDQDLKRSYYTGLPDDPVELERLRASERRLWAECSAMRYAHNAAVYTEEMIVKGPVEPCRIKLFRKLPLEKPY